mgnify:CR=1 FL=1
MRQKQMIFKRMVNFSRYQFINFLFTAGWPREAKWFGGNTSL